jgi:hypothetical protein
MTARLLTELEIVDNSDEIAMIKMGIYFLIKNRRVVYVGKSVHIDARLISHQRTGKTWDRWYWVPCQPELLDYLERQYLDLLLPPWNLDSETKTKRGDPKPKEEIPSPVAIAHPLAGVDWEWFSGEDEDAEAESMIVRERMLRVRAMRKCDTEAETTFVTRDSVDLNG